MTWLLALRFLAAKTMPPMPRASSRPNETVVEASGTAGRADGPKARNVGPFRPVSTVWAVAKVPLPVEGELRDAVAAEVCGEQVAQRVEGQTLRPVRGAAGGEDRGCREGARPRRGELRDAVIPDVRGEQVALGVESQALWSSQAGVEGRGGRRERARPGPGEPADGVGVRVGDEQVLGLGAGGGGQTPSVVSRPASAVPLSTCGTKPRG